MTLPAACGTPPLLSINRLTDDVRDMKTERPVYLSLTQFAWPVAAIASITHRMTGVALFAAIAYLLWLLGLAVASPEGFERAAGLLAQPLPKLILLAVLVALAYHLFAGIKHMVMDFHHWDSLEGGRRGAIGVFFATLATTVAAGVWLW
jgi:succinate dehydrogenase / fumarate reductase, cytochrome b subunit